MENYDNPIIEREYNIPLVLFEKAFTAFQKKFTYPKTYMIIGCYMLIIIWQFINIVINGSRTLSYVVIGVCCALIFNSWFNPKKIRRNLLNSIEEIETDLYKFKLYDDCISLLALSKEEVLSLDETQEEPEKSENDGNTDIFDGYMPEENEKATFLMFNNEYFYIIEKDEYYMLYQSKIMFYVVPKIDFSDGEIMQMNEFFTEKLEKRFECG